ncbi:hypothetical protein ScPMuIL_002355 [Solemya velum]
MYISAYVILKDDHGVFRGETTFVCMLGEEVEGGVTWKKDDTIIEDSDEDYVKRHTGGTNIYELTVKDTKIADYGTYVCTDGSEVASEEFNSNRLEAFRYTISVEEFKLKMDITFVKPAPPSVSFSTQGRNIHGTYEQGTSPSKFTWISNEEVIPGTYDYTYSNSLGNGGHIEGDDTYEVEAFLRLVGSYGILNGETKLECMFKWGTVDSDNDVVWQPDLGERAVSKRSGDTFTYTIKNTVFNDLDVDKYTCTYPSDGQSASYTIVEADIQALEWNVARHGDKLVIDVEQVRPWPATVSVLLRNEEQDGEWGSGTPDARGFTYSYTWTSDATVIPGTYSCTVRNDGALTKTYDFTVKATLTLSGTHGVFEGDTILKCTLEAGTVTDNTVIWSSESSPVLEDGDKYTMSSNDGDTFTLTIKTTVLGDLKLYTCKYGDQTASYTLTGSGIEALRISSSIEDSKLVVTVSEVRPSPPVVTVTLKPVIESVPDVIVIGTLSAGSHNDDGLTNSYIWTSQENVVPGKHDITVNNKMNMELTSSHDVPAMLTLKTGYGKYGEETELLCLLWYISVVDDGVVWQFADRTLIDDENDYIKGTDGDTFTLTIKKTKHSDLRKYTCRYGEQSADYTLQNDVMQALELSVSDTNSKIGFTITMVKPWPPHVDCSLGSEHFTGEFSDEKTNTDGVTKSFTWTSIELKAGKYSCTVNNGEDLQKTYTVRLEATLGMHSTHGILGGMTKLVCIMEAGTVGDDVIQWKKTDNPITDDNKYDMTNDVVDSSTLTIKNTVKDDLAGYSCVLGDQTASYTLSDTDIEALEVEVDTDENHRLVITLSEVKPGEPTVVVKLDGMQTEIEGVLSEATPNADPFTDSYTWISTHKAVPAHLTLVGTYGILGGETTLECMFEYGTVEGGTVEWVGGLDNEDHDISAAQGDTFTLKIMDTQPRHVIEHSCTYGQQKATYRLTNDKIQALQWDVIVDGGTFTVVIKKIKPDSPAIVVTSSAGPIAGSFDDGVANDDGLTTSYIWTPSGETRPGTYECSVDNGKDLSEKRTFDLPATLTLVGSHGVLLGKTTLMCSLRTGSVNGNTHVVWERAGEPLEDGDKYTISTAVGDTFSLTIENTQPADLTDYTCKFDSQSAKYFLINTVIQALEVNHTVSEDSVLTITVHRVKPYPPTIQVMLNNQPQAGILSSGTLNGDGFTYSYTWTLEEKVVPATYSYTVTNGEDLSVPGQVVIPGPNQDNTAAKKQREYLKLYFNSAAGSWYYSFSWSIQSPSVATVLSREFSHMSILSLTMLDKINGGSADWVRVLVVAVADRAASLTLVGSYGLFGEETTLTSTFGAGTVSDNSVRWSTPLSEDLSDDDNFEVSEAKGVVFTLTIKNTQPSDLLAYTCQYKQQRTTYVLTHTVMEALLWDITYTGSTLIITVSNVKPSPAIVEVKLQEENVPGKLSETTFNNDGFTKSQTWTSSSNVVPGTYDCIVRNAKSLTKTGSYTVPATLKLDGTHGVFGGKTRLVCTVEYGTVTANGEDVKWLKSGEEIQNGDDYEISGPVGEQFTLIILNTTTAHFVEYTCGYKEQTSKYTLIHTVTQALILSAEANATRLSLTIHKIKPPSPIVFMKLDNLNVTGDISNGELNEDGFTHSYTWMSSGNLLPGTYDYTVSNGQDLTETGTVEIQATLTLFGSHGVFGGDTKLICTLGYGTVSDNEITWSTANLILDDTTKFSISTRTGDRFILTIHDTQSNDMGPYACQYGEQKATYTLVNTDMRECDTNHYGINCENECKCNKTNTVDCDSGDGSCTCKTGWEGHLCQSDVNEYQSNRITIKLKINIDLSTDEKKSKAKLKMKVILTDFYSLRVAGFLEVIILALRSGSLYIDHTVVRSNTETARSDLSSALRNLVDGTSQLFYDGELAVVEEVTLTTNDGVSTQTVNLTPEVDLCSVFTSLKDCDEGYECYVSEVGARCRLKSQNDNTDLIIGLSVGIPLLVIALFLIVLCSNYRGGLSRRRGHVRETPHHEPRTDRIKTIPARIDVDEESNGSFGAENYPFGNTAYYGDMKRVTHWPSNDRVFNPHNNVSIV